MNHLKVIGATFLLWAVAGAAAAAPVWIGSWGASPVTPAPARGPFPATPSYSNVTIREVVRLSIGGDRIRLRLTNKYGHSPLKIGAVSVAKADASGNIVAGTEHPVTFGGARSTRIPAGAPLVSDPIDMSVANLGNLSVSLYLPGDTGPCTCHQVGRQTAYVSAPGNFTGRAFKAAKTMTSRAFLSGVEVRTNAPAHAVVAFGDSITDGVGSTVGANHRWPDLLADRLVAHKDAWGVVNAGISGNQVLRAGAGESALARFDRDVLSVPGVAAVIVFEGINDIGIRLGHSRFGAPAKNDSKLTAASLIAGLKQLIYRAHSKGLKIYGATITPYKGAAYYSDAGEAVRRKVNQWIRTSGAFDAVLDFDALWRDPKHPDQIRNSLQAGDHLHGSDAGYRVLSNSIDLKLF